MKLYLLTIFTFLSLSFSISEKIGFYSDNQEDFANIPVEDLTFTAVAGIDNDGDPIILLHGSQKHPECGRI